MHAIDHNGNLDEIMLDERRSIPKDHLDSVCKIHQGKKTCRYIGLGVKGFVCVKNSAIQPILDEKVQEKTIKSCGDNCEGILKNLES